MLSNVHVIPSRANQVRALAKAEPALNPLEIARRLGLHGNTVKLALDRGDTFKPKSVAK
jgi:hypothetical protein